MSSENIEEILNSLGGEDVPGEVKKIAQETSEKFSSTLLQSKQRTLLENIMKSSITKLAVAAAAIIAIGFLITHHGLNKQSETIKFVRTKNAPAALITLASLNIALRDGGIDAVDKQLDEAFKKSGPWPVNSKSQAIQNYSICMHIE